LNKNIRPTLKKNIRLAYFDEEYFQEEIFSKSLENFSNDLQ